MADDERLRMKRKDIHRANVEFSDFSLSSPARKIRRLDVDLPPISEELEIDIAMQETDGEEEEEDESAPANEERAIVLYKPPQYHQSPSGQLFVDRNLIFDLKNTFLGNASSIANDNNDDDQTSDICQAVVCWNPCQSPYSHSVGTFQQPRALEIVELDETGDDAVMDEAAMDIEEDNRSIGVSFPQQGKQQHEEPTYDGFGLHHQWQQQQHCMIPQLHQVSTTPITWFR